MEHRAELSDQSMDPQNFYVRCYQWGLRTCTVRPTQDRKRRAGGRTTQVESRFARAVEVISDSREFVPSARGSGFEGYRVFNVLGFRNHAESNDQFVRWFSWIDDLRVSRFPLRLPSWNLNAFFIYTATIGTS